MIEVAGIWEDGWNVPLMESVQWEMMLREFGVEHLNMIPITGIAASWGAAPWINEYQDMNELISAKPDLIPVYVTEHAEIELSEFEHPENALYVFGRANKDVTVPKDALAIRIAPGKGCLWAHQACTVVLYDRVKK